MRSFLVRSVGGGNQQSHSVLLNDYLGDSFRTNQVDYPWIEIDMLEKRFVNQIIIHGQDKDWLKRIKVIVSDFKGHGNFVAIIYTFNNEFDPCVLRNQKWSKELVHVAQQTDSV